VSAERVFELARHLTERDREVALYLYRHRVLTTEQLQLLFFSSRRRAQDRLLFLYRNRVLDRFYPAAPFGSGKPEAHWLLDEAGAILVATMHNLERKQLQWHRRDDWGSHPQLAHQLETNRFVTDLIAATLTDPGLGSTSGGRPPMRPATSASVDGDGCCRTPASTWRPTPGRSSATWSGTARPKRSNGLLRSCSPTGAPRPSCSRRANRRAASCSSCPAPAG
jgi:Replication-relaxation